MSDGTVRRRLVAAGLKARIPRKKNHSSMFCRGKSDCNGQENMYHSHLSNGTKSYGAKKLGYRYFGAMLFIMFATDLERLACLSA